MDLLNTEAMG